MIAGGTVLGGRYLIEGERPGDDDELPSWWAVDRQLRRRVVVVVMPGDAGSLDVARTARLDYAGRLLDGGEHEGRAYLVIRAEPGAPPVGEELGPMTAPPPPDPDATIAAPRPPAVHADATEAFALAGADATAVQPVPSLAAPVYALPPPPAAAGGRPSVSSNTVMRLTAMGVASFVLGAGAVFAVGVLANPEPQPPSMPVNAAGDPGPAPDRTLPSAPLAPVTIPSTEPSTTVTTRPSTTRKARPTTTAPRPTTTRSPRTTTTRRCRGRACPDSDER